MIDVAARDEVKNRMKERIANTERRINELAEKEVNPNSSKQMIDLLYGKLHFPVMYGKTGKPTTDEDALLKLHKKYPSEEILSAIISYRKDTKLVSTFLEVLLDKNNRIHTSYNASGTKNFRISSSKDLWGSGMNLQNIPKGKRAGIENIRHIFIADEGFSLVKCDLKQAEAMAVARILCRYKDYSLWDRYANDPEFDIHKWAAAPIFHITENEVTKTQRDVGKISNHGGNYCAGPGVIMGLALKYGIDGIDYHMSKQIIAAKKALMPGLVKWWKDVEKQLIATRALHMCLGRNRIFFGRMDDNTVIRDAVAFEPQSTIGDVTNIMFASLYERLKPPAIPILQVHDECVVLTPDSYVPEVIALMKEVSQIPLNLNKDLEPLIIPLEISVGKNWKDTKDVC